MLWLWEKSWWVKEWTQSYDVQDDSNASVSNSVLLMNMAPMSFNDFGSNARTFAHATQDSSVNAWNDFVQPRHGLNYYLGIYILITTSQIFVGAARFGFIYWGSLRASKALYVELLRRVFRAPLRFFGM